MEKQCATCKAVKPWSEFHIIKLSGKPRPYCHPCQKARSKKNYTKHKAKINAKNAEWARRPGNIEKRRRAVREWHYRTNYGITVADKDALRELQENRCAICRTDFREMATRHVHVDHCHKDGHVRGILCYPCNQLLANCRDNISVLEGAIDYLTSNPDAVCRLRAKAEKREWYD